MRLKFSLATVFLITTIVGMGVQMRQMHLDLLRSKSELAFFETFRNQSGLVTKGELELNSALKQIRPQTDARLFYAWLGQDGLTDLICHAENANDRDALAIGLREERVKIHNLHLGVCREKAKLQDLGLEYEYRMAIDASPSQRR